MAKAAHPQDVHVFGVRHHGPGSARRVLEALEELRPAAVLVEGPTDLSELAAMLASEEMVPPVTLTAYAAEDPSLAIFWPFAGFSPEYQAMRWALANGAETAFIDLPATWRLAAMKAAKDAAEAARAEAQEAAAREQEAAAREQEAAAREGGEGGDAGGDPEADAAEAAGPETADAAPPEDPAAAEALRLRADPIGALARAAGYEDGESWWRDVFEENPSPGPVFEAIAEAMTALREAAGEAPEIARGESDLEREAHMRLEIAKARKAHDGPIAVICGAWHVPALLRKHSAAEDRARLKGREKVKTNATWAPWTAPRLAFASGYGAGVTAPNWCAHLWACPAERAPATWLARTAAALRDQGQIVSTASIIEAERLSKALAAMRGRPSPGFEELREASIACLCFGEALQWRQIETALLIGSEVGAVPEDAPQAPLLADLQRQQKAARLKPEGLDRELSLDLRSESGLARSVLLHRLQALDVPWGRLSGAGRSRGTFRENWALRWEPEFAIRLVEHVVYGATLEQAANGRTIARLDETEDLGALADLALQAMTAQLDAAAAAAIRTLDRRAAETSDCGQLMAALAPLADIVRYGEARARDSAQLGDLARRILIQAALALPYAARGLDAAAAREMNRRVAATDRALSLLSLEAADREVWRSALRDVLEDGQAARLVAGLAARLLYEAEALDAGETAAALARRLSPGEAAADAAGFFEGFFQSAGQRLIFDEALREAVDGWVVSLDEEAFRETLPLFRRVLSALDSAERRRLLDRLFGLRGAERPGWRTTPESLAAWDRRLARLTDILTAEPRDDRS